MKFIITFVLCMLASTAFAEASLDGVDKKLDRVLDNQGAIINAVENNPLAGKKFGMELNFFRALTFGVSPDSKSISGGFSIFDVENKVEYAFPMFYVDEKNTFDNSTFSMMSIDAQYRKFLGETLNGFYIAGFARAAKLKGTLGDSTVFSSAIPTQTGSEVKLGVGVGIGYRIFSESGWYWGTSLIAGRYLIGENDKFYNGLGFFYDDSEVIFDVELLKFGYAF